MIPKNWIVKELGDVAFSTKGKKPKFLVNEYNEEFSVPYVNIKAFEGRGINEYTNGEKCVLCKSTDILIVWDGARFGLVGKGVAGAIGSTLAHIQSEIIVDTLLFYFLQYHYRYIQSRPKGVGIPHVDPNILWKIKILIPPLNEQHRIVEKIEELFTKLDAAVTELKNVKKQLKRYRQSVLKSAFEGKSTEEWRKENKSNLDISNVENDIKNLIEKKYLEDVKYSIENGLPKPKHPLKNKISDYETKNLAIIPSEWKYLRLESLCYKVSDGTHHTPKYQDSGIIFLSVKNVRPHLIKDQDIKYITEEEHLKINNRCNAEKGDILYTKVGATFGYAAIANVDYPFSIFVSLALIKPVHTHVFNKYLEYAMNSLVVFAQAKERVSGSGRPDLHLVEIRDFRIPYCSFLEQQKIVEEIESRLSVADKIEEGIDKNLKRTEQLRQSILKKAFEGKLVPQDPNDEPAEKLLERIKKGI